VGALAVVLVGGVVLAGSTVVLVGLVGGLFFQVVWNWSGAADATAEAVERALR